MSTNEKLKITKVDLDKLYDIIEPTEQSTVAFAVKPKDEKPETVLTEQEQEEDDKLFEEYSQVVED